MIRFANTQEADSYLAARLDRPVDSASFEVGGAVSLDIRTIFLPDGCFTNAYTLRWCDSRAKSSLIMSDPLQSAREVAAANPNLCAVATGSFFFLADRCDYRPRSLNLNLCVGPEGVQSLPVVAQEALICRRGALRVEHVQARGVLTLDRQRFTWIGSRAGGVHSADCSVYGNANSIIEHRHHPQLGRARFFVPESRFTPHLCDVRWVDVGCRAQPQRSFVVTAVSREGHLDIFQYDLVLRVPPSAGIVGSTVRIQTIGSLTLDASLDGAISVGPSLLHKDLASHPLHREHSLGSYPLLAHKRSARLVFFRCQEGWQHLCLFDGRPGSVDFQGVSLEEAVALVEERGVVAGCFLDSGNTSKFAVRQQEELVSYGNRHYLQWPARPGEDYLWTPDTGRRTASLLALQCTSA